MTGYEHYQRAQANLRIIRELWNPPLDTAVMKVDTRRPTQGRGIVSVSLPAFRGRTAHGWQLAGQNLAALQDRAAAIRAEIDLVRQSKDRGS